MKELPKLGGMDLAALLCSRVCHDVISPVGAIANGLELLDEDTDQETKEIAMDLIRSSAKNASAKLQFSRIAFGAAGSAKADIDTGDAQSVAQAYFDTEKKIDLIWHGERALMPKNKVKLLLNLLLVSLGAVPRGGSVTSQISDPNGEATFTVTCSGNRARVPPLFLDLINGTFEDHVDAHAIQPVYTLLLAADARMEISAQLQGENVVISAHSI
jgi:histidine phosphotransferase ChpT